MKERIKPFVNYFVMWKYRIGYAGGLLSTFASILIITNTFQNKMELVGKPINYLYALLITIVLMIIGAYILDKMGFIEGEVNYSNTKNQMLNEIHKK